MRQEKLVGFDGLMAIYAQNFGALISEKEGTEKVFFNLEIAVSEQGDFYYPG